MNQDFIDYLYSVYGKSNGTAAGYIQAIRILDNIFLKNDVFHLNGISLSALSNLNLVVHIKAFIREEETKLNMNHTSIFDDLDPNKKKYTKYRWYSVAMNNLVNFIGVMNARKKNIYVNTNSESKDSSYIFELAKQKTVKKQTNNVSQCKNYNIFIAGSKNLSSERDAIRSIFSQISNITEEISFHTITYEDFDSSLKIGGRQQDYNNFIREKADYVLFILNDQIGGITEEEFNIAYKSFSENGHPNILVYCAYYENDNITLEIQKIRDCMNSHNQYYTEYGSIKELKDRIKIEFLTLLVKTDKQI